MNQREADTERARSRKEITHSRVLFRYLLSSFASASHFKERKKSLRGAIIYYLKQMRCSVLFAFDIIHSIRSYRSYFNNFKQSTGIAFSPSRTPTTPNPIRIPTPDLPPHRRQKCPRMRLLPIGQVPFPQKPQHAAAPPIPEPLRPQPRLVPRQVLAPHAGQALLDKSRQVPSSISLPLLLLLLIMMMMMGVPLPRGPVVMMRAPFTSSRRRRRLPPHRLLLLSDFVKVVHAAQLLPPVLQRAAHACRVVQPLALPKLAAGVGEPDATLLRRRDAARGLWWVVGGAG
jgi:hypothetical protein